METLNPDGYIDAARRPEPSATRSQKAGSGGLARGIDPCITNEYIV